jgi:hypothetical protein
MEDRISLSGHWQVLPPLPPRPDRPALMSNEHNEFLAAM